MHSPKAKTVTFPVPVTTLAYLRVAICGVTAFMAAKKLEMKV